MGPALFEGLAFAVMVLHLGWILWVILGVLLTRHRPVAAWLHIGSLVYSIGIEAGPWPCPLTLAEQYFLERAGVTPYRQSFLVHYLEAFIYPDIPPGLLVGCAVSVCLAILGIYGLRFRKDRRF